MNTSPSRRASSDPGGVPSASTSSPLSRFVRNVAGSLRSSMPTSCRCAVPRGWMKTSIWPPHASPTSNATSSATPKAAIFGVPDFRTFCASSKTAPSMQPLETEPAILPERVTSILEPSGLGLDPHVSMTVATAMSSPPAIHSFSSSKTSLIAGSCCRSPFDRPLRGGSPSPSQGGKGSQEAAEILEGVDIVGREKVVAEGQRRRHPPRQRLVTLRTQQWVEPDQPVRGAPQVDELGGELCGIAAIPPVADDDHHRAIAAAAARPAPVEIPDRVAAPAPAAEVVDAFAHRVAGAVEVSIAQQPRAPRQSRREDEGLEVFAPRDRVGEDHQEPRVALHRAAHVADQHQRPAADARFPPEKGHQLAARADGVTRRTPQVDAT